MKRKNQILFRKLSLVLVAILMVSVTWAQQSISGKIVDSDGIPLPGVAVIQQGTANGTASNIDGDYTLSAPADAVLQFSFVGMLTLKEEVKGRSTIDVIMRFDAIGIEEVIAVGYGTMKKSDLTGSVMSVGSEQYDAQPLTKMDQALQGRAAGVQVTQTSGAPGSVMKIRVRGTNSISGNNNPLYVLDGMVISDIGSINVNDIASMEVLKDASATAIYGSRGANGVILITTKTGKKGKSVITFETFHGVSNVFQKLPMMTPVEFAEGVNFAEDQEIFNAVEIDAIRGGRSVDWQEEFFKAAPSHNYLLSFSGGKDNIDYFISGSYYDADGTIINQNYKRYTLRTNVNANLTDNFKVGVNMSGSREIGTGVRANLSQGLTADPTTPIYNEDGEYNYASEKGVGNGNPAPMLAPLENIRDDYENRLNTTAYLDLTIVKNLVLNVSGGVNYLARTNNSYQPIVVNTRGVAAIDLIENSLLQNTNRLTYTFNNADKHKFQFDAIHEQQYAKNVFVNTAAEDFFSDGTTYKDMSLGQIQTIENGEAASSLQSFLGRANYSFADKYLITGSIRADGSSKFREDQRWGYFPSGSVAWRASQEGFMQDIEAVSNLKVRASYGITGSQAIGVYATRSRPVTGADIKYPFTGDVANVGVAPSNRLANPDLTWEKTAQSNIGIDLGLWDNKLTLSFDAYKKITSDLLLDRSLPQFVGPTVVAQNIGKMENKGFEFAIGYTALQTNDWSVTGTVTLNRNVNKVLELVTDEPIEQSTSSYLGQYLPVQPTRLEIGNPMTIFRGYVFEGVYQIGDEEAAAVFNRKPGDAIYADLSGPDGVPDGIISPDDITTVGDGSPDFTFGLNGNVSWKALSLDYLFTGSIGNDIYNFQRARMMSLGAATFHASHADYKDRWTVDNPSNTIPSGRDGTEALTSAFIEDGSYFTLKNISLGYTFSNIEAFKVIGLDALKIYGSIENAFILTNYTGFDPESTATGNSDVEVGIDLNAYPLARTFTAGIKFTF